MTVANNDAIAVNVAPQTMLSITEPAANRLTAMMQEKELEGYALRVFVSGGGCSGMQYGMTFDNEQREGDSEMEQFGLRVVVDPISSQYLSGSSIDYVDSLMGGGFKIENPNAVSACGCGHSFRTRDDADAGEAASGGGCGTCGS
jgi:iron-sulfur cluster assembly accessory protein